MSALIPGFTKGTEVFLGPAAVSGEEPDHHVIMSKKLPDYDKAVGYWGDDWKRWRYRGDLATVFWWEAPTAAERKATQGKLEKLGHAVDDQIFIEMNSSHDSHSRARNMPQASLKRQGDRAHGDILDITHHVDAPTDYYQRWRQQLGDSQLSEASTDCAEDESGGTIWWSDFDARAFGWIPALEGMDAEGRGVTVYPSGLVVGDKPETHTQLIQRLDLDDIDGNDSRFLTRSDFVCEGRYWLNRQVLSFWADEKDVPVERVTELCEVFRHLEEARIQFGDEDDWHAGDPVRTVQMWLDGDRGGGNAAASAKAEIERAAHLLGAKAAGRSSSGVGSAKAMALAGDEPVAAWRARRSTSESGGLAAWFGQSKVIDDAGKPLAVWHGTSAKFDEFDNAHAQDGAHFFTANPSHAAHFGTARSYYLKIENPLVISQDELEARWDLEVNDEGESGVLPRDMVSHFVREAKAAGHDGLIIRQMADLDLAADVYLPFSAAQIKACDALIEASADQMFDDILYDAEEADAYPVLWVNDTPYIGEQGDSHYTLAANLDLMAGNNGEDESDVTTAYSEGWIPSARVWRGLHAVTFWNAESKVTRSMVNDLVHEWDDDAILGYGLVFGNDDDIRFSHILVGNMAHKNKPRQVGDVEIDGERVVHYPRTVASWLGSKTPAAAKPATAATIAARQLHLAEPRTKRAMSADLDKPPTKRIDLDVRQKMQTSEAQRVVEAAALPATMYHLTDQVDFKLDDKLRPAIGGDWDPGIFLGDSVEHWVNGYGYWRPWVVEFDPSALEPSDLAFGHESGEVLVKAAAYPKLRVKRVVPLDAHCREVFGDYGWTETFFGTDFRTGEPIDTSQHNQQCGYRYPGDARQEPAAWRTAYKLRVKDYARKSGRANGVYGGINEAVTKYPRDPDEPAPGTTAKPGADRFYAGYVSADGEVVGEYVTDLADAGHDHVYGSYSSGRSFAWRYRSDTGELFFWYGDTNETAKAAVKEWLADRGYEVAKVSGIAKAAIAGSDYDSSFVRSHGYDMNGSRDAITLTYPGYKRMSESAKALIEAVTLKQSYEYKAPQSKLHYDGDRFVRVAVLGDDGKKIGELEVQVGERYATVRNALIYDQANTAKGVGQAAYRALRDQFPGKVIRSSDGFSQQAAYMWQALERKGLAKSVGDHYALKESEGSSAQAIIEAKVRFPAMTGYGRWGAYWIDPDGKFLKGEHALVAQEIMGGSPDSAVDRLLTRGTHLRLIVAREKPGGPQVMTYQGNANRAQYAALEQAAIDNEAILYQETAQDHAIAAWQRKLRYKPPEMDEAVTWDAVNGIGAVPDNQDVGYKGFTRQMTAAEFRRLVPPGVSGRDTKAYVTQQLGAGKPLGQLFLIVKWDEANQRWQVIQHEGRSRADAIAGLYPDELLPVHIFPRGLRAHDLTPEMLAAPLEPDLKAAE